MSKVLIVNAGSSSLKFKLFDMPKEDVLADGEVERLNMPAIICMIKAETIAISAFIIIC